MVKPGHFFHSPKVDIDEAELTFGITNNLMVKIPPGFWILEGRSLEGTDGSGKGVTVSVFGRRTLCPGLRVLGCQGSPFSQETHPKKSPRQGGCAWEAGCTRIIGGAQQDMRPAGNDRGWRSVLTGRRTIMRTRATCPAGRPAPRALLLAALLGCLVAESCGKLKQQHTTHRLQLHVSPRTF